MDWPGLCYLGYVIFAVLNCNPLYFGGGGGGECYYERYTLLEYD